jgi:hypothetical protein
MRHAECSYLEGKVLEEVCGAIGLIRLGARSGVDPDTDSGRLSPGRVLRGNLDVSISSRPTTRARLSAYRQAVCQGCGLSLGGAMAVGRGAQRTDGRG